MKQVKFLLTFLPILFLGVSVFAQKNNIGIGTTKPDQSAVLDINSTDKGLLMPRMSLQQRNGIQNPAQGLVVYQTDFISGFYFYDGKEWKAMTNEANANSVADDPSNWSKTGNVGTNPATNFIGTTDNAALRFRVNNIKAGEINNTSANTYLGFQAGLTGTGTDNVGLGLNSLYTNTTGSSNIGIGVQSLFLNTSGRNNTAIGHFAMRANTVGESNMSIGSFSLSKNTSGAGNMAIGVNALRENTLGSLNTAVGTQALLNLTGAGTSFNTAIGESAMLGNTSGSSNTAVGYEAGKNNILGSNNIFLGNQAGFGETESNKLYVSNSNTTLPLIYGDFSAKFISIGDVGVAGDPVATAAKRNSLAAQYGLLVQKGILTEKIKVATMTTTDWADYVFEKDYKRMSLEEVEKFVNENKHLPNVPTTTEMMASGSDLIKTDAKLLEKIEELTLYMIEMNKEIKALKVENAKLKK